MKVLLTLIAILAIISTTDASSSRRKRATEGFMGAPARKTHQHHSRKEIATNVAEVVANSAGHAAVKEVKKRRTGDNYNY